VVLKKTVTQRLWVLAAILILIGVIRLLIVANLLGGVILGVGLVLAVIALSRRLRNV
jgi:hypothetical protein